MNARDSFSPDSSITKITDLEPGDHLCCIYETEEEHRNVLTPFIKEGLEANQKVIYIVDANTAEEILDYLRETDYPPEHYRDSGQLLLLTGDESYLKGGTFDPDAMIDLLEKETEKALNQGYSALRVTGEMTWALRGHPGSDRLMEYENKLNRFFPNHQALGLCQYDRTQFDPEVLLGVLRTHPIAVIGNETYENFHYIPPGKLLGDSPKKAEFSSWEEGLRTSKDKKLRLEHKNSLLKAIRNLNQIIVQEEELEPLMKKACKTLLETRSYHSVNLALLEETTGELTPYVKVGEKEFDRSFSISPDGEGDAPICVKKALATGMAQVVSSEKECLDCEYGNPLEGTQALAVPLKSGGEPIGVLHVWTDQEVRIDEEETKLLKEAAGDLALAWEKIKAERRLRKSERNKSILFNNLPGMAYRCENDRDWTMHFVSQGCKDLTGYEPEELVGNQVVAFGDLIAEEDKDRIWKSVQEQLKTRQPYELEYRITTKDGAQKWVWAQGRGVYEEDGELKNLQGYIANITRRKKAEREKREHAERFRSYVESSPLGVFVTDSQGNYVEVNEAASRVTGYDREELMNMNVVDLIPEESRGKAKNHFRSLVEKGEAATELPFLKKDGSHRHWTVKAVKLSEDRFLGFVNDVTDRKEMEQRVEKERDRAQQYLEVAGSIIVLLDQEQKIQEINKKGCQILGYDKEEIIGKDIYENFVPERAREDVIEDTRKPLMEGKTGNASYYENPIVTKDGEERLIAWENEVVRENGQVVGTLSSGIDITERKKMEEELQQRSKQLKNSFVELAETTSRVLGVRDPYTEAHEQRVAELAKEVGRRMGLGEEKLLGLYIGGVLHDIGKIVVPETILSKPGELKDVEWEMIRSHPKVGYNQILADTDFPWPVAEMTLHHHERLDGSGYPDGLEGDELTTEVRILGAVDVVEAMSTRRPYREARTKERTLSVIKEGKGEKFDPEVVEILVDMIEEDEIIFEGKD